MISEQRVKLMTRLAAYEQKEGKKNEEIGSYFRGDYISFQILKSVIGATMAFILIVALFVFYDSELFLSDIYKIDILEYVKKLIEQLNTPKEYDILIMFNSKEGPMMRQALDNAKIKYKFHNDTYFFVQGDQNILAKIREIAPPSAKIYPYAKKMESVIPKEEMEVIKKPSNNTAEKKAAAKTTKKLFGGSYRYAHRQKGRVKTLADIHRASRYVKKHLKKGVKIDVKKVFKVVEERKKGGAATTVYLNAKKSSTGSKKASASIKKAA